MKKIRLALNSSLIPGAAPSAVLLAGCGGSGSGGGELSSGVGGGTPPVVEQTIGDPIAINGLTLESDAHSNPILMNSTDDQTR